MTDRLAFMGYLLAAASFLLLSVLLVTRWRGRVEMIALPLAAITSTGWALALAHVSLVSGTRLVELLFAEMALNAVWILLISQILASATATGWLRLFRYTSLLLVAITMFLALTSHSANLSATSIPNTGTIVVWGSLLISLAGLVGVEQIYRNARTSQQNALKFICLGIATIFAYNLFLYSNAIVSGRVNDIFWGARGFVLAMSVPLLAVGVYRSPNWTRGLFVSRQIVFYTTTLLGAGAYFAAIGFVGYYIGVIGGSWGTVAQLVFFCAALLLFIILILSDQTRAKVRVFLSRHFLENKYDYRDEWLRLIDTLTEHRDGLPLKKRAIKALAQIIDADAGLLWLGREKNESYACVSSWNRPVSERKLSASHELVAFLRENGWVIDLDEFHVDPDRYPGLSEQDGARDEFASGIVVPLMHEQELFGFVSLSRPRIPYSLDFEDHDLLKTIGQQIASYLVQEYATEQLAEHRQFEAFNKLTAFIMHDLKNALAQQSLVVENAERHKRNPKFIDDAIDTIKGSVTRLNRVLDHLQRGKAQPVIQNIKLSSVVRHAVRACANRDPAPEAIIKDEDSWVTADHERLQAAIQHAIHNAQDATEHGGHVRVCLLRDGEVCDIVISDTGAGMNQEFIREHLFRPFDSTKGPEGMGIGAYQIRETVRAAGGDVVVNSTPGQGTELRLRLPVRKA